VTPLNFILDSNTTQAEAPAESFINKTRRVQETDATENKTKLNRATQNYTKSIGTKFFNMEYVGP